MMSGIKTKEMKTKNGGRDEKLSRSGGPNWVGGGVGVLEIAGLKSVIFL